MFFIIKPFRDLLTWLIDSCLIWGPIGEWIFHAQSSYETSFCSARKARAINLSVKIEFQKLQVWTKKTTLHVVRYLSYIWVKNFNFKLKQTFWFSEPYSEIAAHVQTERYDKRKDYPFCSWNGIIRCICACSGDEYIEPMGICLVRFVDSAQFRSNLGVVFLYFNFLWYELILYNNFISEKMLMVTCVSFCLHRNQKKTWYHTSSYWWWLQRQYSSFHVSFLLPRLQTTRKGIILE